LLFIGIKYNISDVMMKPIAMFGVLFSLGGVLMIMMNFIDNFHSSSQSILSFIFSSLISLGLLLIFLRYLFKKYVS